MEGGFGYPTDVYAAGAILYEMCTLNFEEKELGEFDEIAEEIREIGYSDEMVALLGALLEPEMKERKSMINIIRSEFLPLKERAIFLKLWHSSKQRNSALHLKTQWTKNSVFCSKKT